MFSPNRILVQQLDVALTDPRFLLQRNIPAQQKRANLTPSKEFYCSLTVSSQYCRINLSSYKSSTLRTPQSGYSIVLCTNCAPRYWRQRLQLQVTDPSRNWALFYLTVNLFLNESTFTPSYSALIPASVSIDHTTTCY